MIRSSKNIYSEEELIKYAFDFSSFLKPGNIIFLEGELGAGKTTFVKGIALKFNINEPITSPTYTIIKDYSEKLCHIDAYRIYNEDIGIDYYQEKGFVICVEWANNMEQTIKPTYTVKIDYIDGGRKVTIE